MDLLFARIVTYIVRIERYQGFLKNCIFGSLSTQMYVLDENYSLPPSFTYEQCPN